ncbi:MAG TPA: hypothetical protein VI997_05100 [Candidatus Thermoplasmatota archaeon]|nr:hypothetical protein [Candidatus Thermoplasmatota archaeon]
MPAKRAKPSAGRTVAGTSARSATRRPGKDATARQRTPAKRPSAAARPDAPQRAPPKAPRKGGKVASRHAVAKIPNLPPKAAAPKTIKYPGAHVRMRIPIATYEAAKDAFKAPVKAQGLKWQYLGPGQGRYFDDKVAIFAKFGDNVDYSLRGDAKRVQQIVDEWRRLGAADVTETAQAEDESAALKAWKLDEPVRRPGEPEGFLNRRRAEWEARKPR